MAVVFGLLGMRLAFAQMLSFVRKPREKMFWWYTHLGSFIGSYIAAWTAFSVVTLQPLFHTASILVWLWPTAVGVPAIVLTTMYYRRKLAQRSRAAVAAV